jgi:hypothetical protein
VLRGHTRCGAAGPRLARPMNGGSHGHGCDAATPRPYRMPSYRVLTVVLMVLVAVATVQLTSPGLGSSWFGSDFIPEGWTYTQRFTYLWTELIPGADLS